MPTKKRPSIASRPYGGFVLLSEFSPPSQLRNFKARVIADQKKNYTFVSGRFSPSTSIDLTSQLVILSLAEANDFRQVFSPGSFRKTVLGGYVACAIEGVVETEILLTPFGGGDWAYSAIIDGFVPGSTPLTLCLTIGSKTGSATVKLYLF
jgi:hypothetical protein